MRTSVVTVFATLLAAASASMTVQLCPPATADSMRLPPQPDVFEVEFGTQVDLNAAIKCCFHNQTTITLAEAAAIGSRDIPLQTVVEVDVTCGGASTLTTKVRGVCAADHSIVVDPLTGVSSCAPRVTYVYDNCTEGGWKTCEVDVRAPAGATVHVMPLSAAVTDSEIDYAEAKLPGLLADYEETALRSYQREAIEFPLKLVQSVSHLSLGTQDANATNVAGARSVQLKVDNTAAWLALSCQACELGTDDWVQITHEASGVFHRLTGTGAGGCVAVDQRALPVSAPELKLEAYFDQGSTQRFECTVHALGVHPPVLASSNGAAATHAAAKTKFRLAQAYSKREGLVQHNSTAAQCQKMKEVRDLPAGNDLLEEQLLALCAYWTDIPDIHTWLSQNCTLICPAGRRSDVQDDLRYIETRGRFRPRPQRRATSDLENVLVARLAENPELRAVVADRRSHQLRAGRAALRGMKARAYRTVDASGRRAAELLESAPAISLRRSYNPYSHSNVSDTTFASQPFGVPSCYKFTTADACKASTACQWRTDRCQVAWNKIEGYCTQYATQATCEANTLDMCVWSPATSGARSDGVYHLVENVASTGAHGACSGLSAAGSRLGLYEWGPVDTHAKCLAAAQANGKTSITTETDVNFPYGCYQWRNADNTFQAFYWNTDGDFNSTGVPADWVWKSCKATDGSIRCTCVEEIVWDLPARCSTKHQMGAYYASDLDSALVGEQSCASFAEAAVLDAYKSTYSTFFEFGGLVTVDPRDPGTGSVQVPFIGGPYRADLEKMKGFDVGDSTRYEAIMEAVSTQLNDPAAIDPAMQQECLRWNATTSSYYLPQKTLDMAVSTVVFFNAVDKWLIRNSRGGWHDQCALMQAVDLFPPGLVVNYLQKAVERFYAAQTMTRQSAIEHIERFETADPHMAECIAKAADDLYIQQCYVLTPQRQSAMNWMTTLWEPQNQKAAGYAGAADVHGDGRSVDLSEAYVYVDGARVKVKDLPAVKKVPIWEEDGQGGWQWNKYAFECPARMERVEREWAAAELAKSQTSTSYCNPACQHAKLDQQLKTSMHASGQLTTDEQDRINANKNLADPESSQSKRGVPDAGFDETFITMTRKNHERLFLVDRKAVTCSARRFGFGAMMSSGSFTMASAGF